MLLKKIISLLINVKKRIKTLSFTLYLKIEKTKQIWIIQNYENLNINKSLLIIGIIQGTYNFMHSYSPSLLSLRPKEKLCKPMVDPVRTDSGFNVILGLALYWVWISREPKIGFFNIVLCLMGEGLSKFFSNKGISIYKFWQTKSHYSDVSWYPISTHDHSTCQSAGGILKQSTCSAYQYQGQVVCIGIFMAVIKELDLSSL